MLTSPALAHGTSQGASSGGVGLLILLAVAIAVVLALIAEKKWRRRKSGRDGSGD